MDLDRPMELAKKERNFHKFDDESFYYLYMDVIEE